MIPLDSPNAEFGYVRRFCKAAVVCGLSVDPDDMVWTEDDGWTLEGMHPYEWLEARYDQSVESRA